MLSIKVTIIWLIVTNGNQIDCKIFHTKQVSIRGSDFCKTRQWYETNESIRYWIQKNWSDMKSIILRLYSNSELNRPKMWPQDCCVGWCQNLYTIRKLSILLTFLNASTRAQVLSIAYDGICCLGLEGVHLFY